VHGPQLSRCHDVNSNTKLAYYDYLFGPLGDSVATTDSVPPCSFLSESWSYFLGIQTLCLHLAARSVSASSRFGKRLCRWAKYAAGKFATGLTARHTCSRPPVGSNNETKLGMRLKSLLHLSWKRTPIIYT